MKKDAGSSNELCISRFKIVFFLQVDFFEFIYVLADLAEWLECLTANANVATVLSSISASSGTSGI